MKKLLMMMVLSCTLLVSNVSAFAVEKIDEVKPRNTLYRTEKKLISTKEEKKEIKSGYRVGRSELRREGKTIEVKEWVEAKFDAKGVLIGGTGKYVTKFVTVYEESWIPVKIPYTEYEVKTTRTYEIYKITPTGQKFDRRTSTEVSTTTRTVEGPKIYG